MAASQYDFKVEQGSSFKLQLIYKDSNSNPINLSGYCARITWNTNLNATQTFTTENADYSTYKFELNTPVTLTGTNIPTVFQIGLQDLDAIYAVADTENVDLEVLVASV